MKIKKIPAAIFSDRLDLEVPESWDALTDRQRRRVCTLLAKESSSDRAAVKIFLYLAGVKMIGEVSEVRVVVQHGKRLHAVRKDDLAAASQSVDVFLKAPDTPSRIGRYKRHRALPADFSEVPFETYIMADNLYQGYLITGREDLLDQMAELLYPGTVAPFPGWMRFNVLFWLISLKETFARTFPDFFSGDTGQDEIFGGGGLTPKKVRDSMNAQIRALTKGDITKEKEVLAMDVYRALTELDLQAKEYKEMNAKMKKR